MKNKEELFNKIIKTFNNISYADGVKRDYETQYPCNGDCSDGGYCRCGKIYETSIKIDYLRFLKEELELKQDSILHYCIERLLSLHKVYHPDSYEIEIEIGYYGEEIGETTFINMSLLREDLQLLFEMESEEQMLQFVLYREYGYLIDVAKDISPSIIEITKNQIYHTNDYFKKVELIERYINWPLPVCLVKELRPNLYSIVDGFHREKMTSNKKSFKVILLK